MPRRPVPIATALLLSALICLLALPAPSARAAGAAPGAAPHGPPRLVVVVVIDQFRNEYLDRFRARFGEDGFARLLRDGARFDACRYPYALTETAPGHATLATGTTPDRHGIVSNEWYDLARGRMVAAVEDERAPILGGAAAQPGCSPRRLEGDALADEIRLATRGRGRSIGIAVKARAAILSAGRAATGAYWYEETTGRMVTSAYYGASLPGWVAAFDALRPADRYVGRRFTAAGRTVVNLGTPGGSPGPSYYEALTRTPYIHDLLFAFAREAVTHEHLGADDDPDFLFLGLSGHDYLGHQVGPYSPAVEEMAARTDAQLADFLRFLDARVGAGRYLLALSSDHGVAPTRAQARAAGLDPVEIDPRAVRAALGRALAARFGAGDPIRLLGGPLRVWFHPDDLARHRATRAEAARIAGAAARAVPGILGYVTPEDTDLDPGTARACRLSFYPGRSPDLLLVPDPFATETRLDPAKHGTPWSYDTHVPLVLYGPPFRHGLFFEPCSPADLAPTLAAALRIPPPAMATGRVLAAALRDAPAPRTGPAEGRARRGARAAE